MGEGLADGGIVSKRVRRFKRRVCFSWGVGLLVLLLTIYATGWKRVVTKVGLIERQRNDRMDTNQCCSLRLLGPTSPDVRSNTNVSLDPQTRLVE